MVTSTSDGTTLHRANTVQYQSQSQPSITKYVRAMVAVPWPAIADIGRQGIIIMNGAILLLRHVIFEVS